MLKTIYFILAIVALGITVWQIGSLFGISTSPQKPDYAITLTALTAAVIFSGLWYAGGTDHEKKS